MCLRTPRINDVRHIAFSVVEIREELAIASDEMRKEEEIGDLWRSFFFAFRPSLHR